MAQAKLNAPDKSGNVIKEKDKDAEEKEGKSLCSIILISPLLQYRVLYSCSLIVNDRQRAKRSRIERH